MRTKFKQLVLTALLVLPLALAAGCSTSSTGSGSSSSCGGLGSQGFEGTVDLAVGDPTGNGTDDLIHLFLDIFAVDDGAVQPDPNITLDNNASAVGAAVNTPASVFLTNDTGGGDLYASSNTNGEILVWRDYRNVSSGDDADVMLDGSGGTPFVTTTELLVDENDNLVVAERAAGGAGDDLIYIYNSASALTGAGGDTADVEIDEVCAGFTNCLLDPISIFVDSGTGTDDLYVGNSNLAGSLVDGDPVVSIFRDIDSIVADQDPDAALTEDVSFFDANLEAVDVYVANNILFVATSLTEVFVFEGADALTTDDLPDAVLFGADAGLGLPLASVVVNGASGDDTLYVASLIDNLISGVAGFSDTDTLATGQGFDLLLDPTSSQINSAFNIQEAGGALFVGGDTALGLPANIFIFKNVQANSLCATSVPNIILSGTGNIGSPDYGPFGTVSVPNGYFAVLVDEGT